MSSAHAFVAWEACPKRQLCIFFWETILFMAMLAQLQQLLTAALLLSGVNYQNATACPACSHACHPQSLPLHQIVTQDLVPVAGVRSCINARSA